MPHNAITERCYSGINVPMLWHQADVCAYERHSWVTFKEAQEKDAAVRKVEKGIHVVFTKKLIVKDENDEERKRKMLKTLVVFNIAGTTAII
jgi:antirestriction protein ArdC